MADLEAALDSHRNAVTDLIAAAERCDAVWTTPRAPGKWSPSQVEEHVARALEESAHVVSGTPSKFPTLPGFLRPIVRGLLFNRVLRKKAFPRARTNKAFDPASGPPTPAAARARLETALAAFEQACRAAGTPTIDSTIFGTVSLGDYVRFQDLHARHHRAQMPVAG